MTGKSNKSSQRIGCDKAAILKQWIAKTPLKKVPLNNKGQSAKHPICKALGITYSTIGSNKEVRSQFAALDEKLLTNKTSEKKSALLSELPPNSLVHNEHVYLLFNEISELRSKLKRFEHWEETGQFID